MYKKRYKKRKVYLDIWRFYNWFIYIYTCKTWWRFTKTKLKNYVTQKK